MLSQLTVEHKEQMDLTVKSLTEEITGLRESNQQIVTEIQALNSAFDRAEAEKNKE